MKHRRWLRVALLGAVLLTAACGQRSGAAGTQPVVSAVALSTTPMSMQPTDQPGETAPGAATGDTMQPGGDVTPQTDGATQTYRDDANAWSVRYPATFTVQERDPETFAALEPRPTAVVAFINPVAMNSDNPDLEPADLEVRIHARGDAQSLEAWLEANGQVTADGSSPARAIAKAHVSGLEVCASTMVAPGCSIFVLGNRAIYQLIPATITGERMIDGFMILS